MPVCYSRDDIAAMSKHWATQPGVRLISQLKLICRKDIAMKLIIIGYSQEHCDLTAPFAEATEALCGIVPAVNGASGAG